MSIETGLERMNDAFRYAQGYEVEGWEPGIHEDDVRDFYDRAWGHVEDEILRLTAALEQIAYAREKQPVRKTTGVIGEPRFFHSWPSRIIALRALGKIE